jgi:hypothetical protein
MLRPAAASAPRLALRLHKHATTAADGSAQVAQWSIGTFAAQSDARLQQRIRRHAAARPRPGGATRQRGDGQAKGASADALRASALVRPSASTLTLGARTQLRRECLARMRDARAALLASLREGGVAAARAAGAAPSTAADVAACVRQVVAEELRRNHAIGALLRCAAACARGAVLCAPLTQRAPCEGVPPATPPPHAGGAGGDDHMSVEDALWVRGRTWAAAQRPARSRVSANARCSAPGLGRFSRRRSSRAATRPGACPHPARVAPAGLRLPAR